MTRTFANAAPTLQAFERDVLRGLGQARKTLPCKYLYDRRGSELFEAICELDEYYLTTTELAVLESSIDEIAKECGPRCLVIEPGSGAGVKTELLLRGLVDPAGYIPIEISKSSLEQTTRRLGQRFPRLSVHPVRADFTKLEVLPELPKAARRPIVFFPASTIGNFAPASAVRLLANFALWVGPAGAVLIGVDLWKDEDHLLTAYNDREGVTAEFNKNLLHHINRELDGNFPVGRFQHEAVLSHEHQRIEMHLVSMDARIVRVRGREFSFQAGESICTEHSHKYRLDDFRELAAEAGLRVDKLWMDPKLWFSVQWLRPIGF